MVPPRPAQPVGVVLAGGRGSRLGEPKAAALAGGEPLIARPLRALAAVLDEVVVVAKPGTPLPPGVPRWDEPEEPVHPLTGIVEALRRAGGRGVLVVATDLARIDPGTLRRLLAHGGTVVPRVGGQLQPLCAVYGPETLPTLAAQPAGVRMRDVVGALAASVLDFADPAPFTNVNTRAELDALRAEREAARAGPDALRAEPRASEA